MSSRDKWIKRVEKIEDDFDFNDGYKFLFGPWSALKGLDTAFLTPLPGLTVPDGADWRLISEERGNSYEIECPDANSPINCQFLSLVKLLNKKPIEILTGVSTPFRAASWNSLSRIQKQQSMALGIGFWKKPLNRKSLKLIIASGSLAANFVLNLVEESNLEQEIPSGWGDVQLRRFISDNGKSIVVLPYLARFKLMSRPACIEPLLEIFDGCLD